MSWKLLQPVPRDLLNEWVCMCIIETHTRQWIITLEELAFVSLTIQARVQRIDRRLRAAETCLHNALSGMESYAAVLDENEAKTSQILTMMRERQFLLEKWAASHARAL